MLLIVGIPYQKRFQIVVLYIYKKESLRIVWEKSQLLNLVKNFRLEEIFLQVASLWNFSPHRK